MREHIRLLGILNIVWGAFSLAVGLVVLFVFGGLAGFLSVFGMNGQDNGQNLLIVGPIMAVVGLVVMLAICCLAAPALIGGIGLLKMKRWSRILMIVLSVLHLINFPFGTALGFYGLWVLFQEDAKRLLEGGMAPPDAPVVRV